jgi:hypothetical protein
VRIDELIPEGPHLDQSDLDWEVAEGRYWLLYGEMRKRFPSLREDQLSRYSIREMERVLTENGVNLGG